MNIADYLLSTIEKIATRIVKAREPVILEGEVKSVKPLKIQVKHYVLEEEHLLVDNSLKETWIRTPTNGKFRHKHKIKASTKLATTNAKCPATSSPIIELQETGELGHKHDIDIETETALPEICLWRGLKEGDKVRLLRLQAGAIHWVFERIDPEFLNDTDKENHHEPAE